MKRTYRTRHKTAKPFIERATAMTVLGVLAVAGGFVLLWAYFSTAQGPQIVRLLTFLRTSLGWARYLAPIILLGLGALLLQQTTKRPWRWPWLELTGIFTMLAAALALSSLLGDSTLQACQSSTGGALGCLLASGLELLVGKAVAVIILGLGGLAGLVLVLHIPFERIVWVFGTALIWLVSLLQRAGFAAARLWREWRTAREKRKQHTPLLVVIHTASESPLLKSEPARNTNAVKLPAPPTKIEPALTQSAETPAGVIQVPRSWVLPSVQDTLVVRQDSQMSLGDIRSKARIIEHTLQSLGVPASVVEVNPGPVVTQFGIEPGYVERYDRDGEVRRAKVKVSRIAALSNDLALALAASPIRIEAPVPGKGIVGLEVPNGQAANVGLRGVIESTEFAALGSKLAIALGRDVSGSAVVADLSKLPHMLIAGATNSGKSVCLNAIIACMLLHNTPDDLKLILVDPKRVELSQYNGIPHLVAPVVVEPDRVLGVLNWLAREMDNRYRTFEAAGTRNIEVYNAQALQRGESKLPIIVLVMDELADLMIVAPEEVEKAICRLAQMARATGIHLVLATQRPSVDVVTGLIKANFPARVAFAVTSQIDSRVILDTPGAEKLLGRGDALLMMPNTPQIARVQGCWVSESELSHIIQFWQSQAAAPVTVAQPIDLSAPVIQAKFWPPEEQTGTESSADAQILAQAREVIQKSGKASVSFLQRNLGIGYTRAARLIDHLEQEGFIGPATGTSKPREILVKSDNDDNI